MARAQAWESGSWSLVALGKPQNPLCSTSPSWERESSLVLLSWKAVVKIQDSSGKHPGGLLQLSKIKRCKMKQEQQIRLLPTKNFPRMKPRSYTTNNLQDWQFLGKPPRTRRIFLHMSMPSMAQQAMETCCCQPPLPCGSLAL